MIGQNATNFKMHWLAFDTIQICESIVLTIEGVQVDEL